MDPASAVVALLVYALTKVADATVTGALERVGAGAVERGAHRLRELFGPRFEQAPDRARRYAWWRFIQNPTDDRAAQDLWRYIAHDLEHDPFIANRALPELGNLALIDARQIGSVAVSQGPGSVSLINYGSGSPTAIGTITNVNVGPSLGQTLKVTGLITAALLFASMPVATSSQGVAFLLLGPASLLFITIWIVAGVRHNAGSGFLVASLATFVFFLGCMVLSFGAA